MRRLYPIWSICIYFPVLLLFVGGVEPLSKRKRFPDFYIIGAPKCATTSLHDLWAQHRQVCRGGLKEVHFFDNTLHYQEVGATSTWKHFYSRHCDDATIYFDSTPDYFANYDAPARMNETFTEEDKKKKRFIIILREPVGRSFSWYNHLLNHCVPFMRNYLTTLKSRNDKLRKENKNEKDGFVPLPINVQGLCNERHCKSLRCSTTGQNATLLDDLRGVESFKAFSEDEEHFPLHVGHYIRHINRWLEFFDRSQFFIVNFEDLVKDTPGTMRRMEVFLGLEHGFSDSVTLPRDNVAHVHTDLDCKTRDSLYAEYAPDVEKLYEYMHKEELKSLPQKDRKPASEPYFSTFPQLQDINCKNM
jgi:hypothetical protein